MYKKSNLFKKVEKESTERKQWIIGVIGTSAGLGVTHFCFMLAHYYSHWLGYKTACISYSPDDEYELVKEYYGGKKEKSYDQMNSFFYQGMTFFHNITELEWVNIINDDFKCIIMDMGHEYSIQKNELLRCNKKIILTCLSPWKLDSLNLFLDEVQEVKFKEQWIYFVPNGQKDFKTKSYVDVPGKMLEIPLEPDPFYIGLKTVDFFSKILR